MKEIHVPTLIMLLPVLLPLIAMTPVLDVESHVKVTPLVNGNLFTKLGMVYVGSAYGHLVVPIRLKVLRQHRQELDLINQHLLHMDEEVRNPYTNESVLSNAAKNKIRWMRHWVNETVTNCLVKLDDALASFEQNNTMIEGTRGRRAVNYVEFPFRGKRQVLVGAIGAGLGAVITGIISKYEEDKLVHIMKKKQDVIIAQLEEDEVAIHQNLADVRRLNNTVGELIKAVHRLSEFYNSTNYIQMTLMTTYSITETTRVIDQVIDALEKARSGTFNINLASTRSMKRGLSMLQQQGLQDGRILGITSIMDLNHVESSYLVDFEEEIVYCIAHVNMPNPQSYLSLYAYKGSPIAIHPSSKIYAQIEYDGYLALTQDNANYQEWSEKSLKSCKKFHDTYFCPQTVKYQRKRRSCLTGLYDSDEAVVHEHCEIHLVHSISEAHQINETSYIVTETDPEDLTIVCKNYKEKIAIHGTVVLQLQQGCVASTKNLVITQPKIVAETTVESKLITTPLDIVTSSSSVEEFLSAADELIALVGQKVNMKMVKSLIKFKKDITKASSWSFTKFIATFTPGSLMSHLLTWLFMAILCITVYYVGKCALTRYCRRRRYRKNGYDSPYDMPGQSPPEAVSFHSNNPERVNLPSPRVIDAKGNTVEPSTNNQFKAILMEDTGVSNEVRKALTEDTNVLLPKVANDQTKLAPKHKMVLSRSGWKLTEISPPEDSGMESSPSDFQESPRDVTPLIAAHRVVHVGYLDPDRDRMMKNALDTNPRIEWFRQNPGVLPNEIHDLEMEALTTYPFTSIIKQCPPDPQTGLIDANRVSKFLGKRRRLRIDYFQTATHAEKQAMEKKEYQKYTEYRGERTIPNISNAINPALL